MTVCGEGEGGGHGIHKSVLGEWEKENDWGGMVHKSVLEKENDWRGMLHKSVLGEGE